MRFDRGATSAVGAREFGDQYEEHGRDIANAPAAVFDQALAHECPDGPRDICRSASQAGSSRTTAPSTSVTSSPSKARRPVSISYSTQPNAQMSLRLSTACPCACSGRHVRGRAENASQPVIIAGVVIVGDCDVSVATLADRVPGPAPSRARSPAPSRCRPARTLMFAGLRSR